MCVCVCVRALACPIRATASEDTSRQSPTDACGLAVVERRERRECRLGENRMYCQPAARVNTKGHRRSQSPNMHSLSPSPNHQSHQCMSAGSRASRVLASRAGSSGGSSRPAMRRSMSRGTGACVGVRGASPRHMEETHPREPTCEQHRDSHTHTHTHTHTHSRRGRGPRSV